MNHKEYKGSAKSIAFSRKRYHPVADGLREAACFAPHLTNPPSFTFSDLRVSK
jgi:hypothetical protein